MEREDRPSAPGAAGPQGARPVARRATPPRIPGAPVRRPTALLAVLAVLAGCPRQPPVVAAPPGPSAPPAPVECTTSADCPTGQTCVGPQGCGVAWTCRADVMCTRDLRTFCACDGRTVQGSGSCPPEPWVHEGACDEPLTAAACEAAGGQVAWPIGPPAACPEGTRPFARVGPAGIEGFGLCCR
jgi:Cys-rich repeat protein